MAHEISRGTLVKSLYQKHKYLTLNTYTYYAMT